MLKPHFGVWPDCVALGSKLRAIDKLECRALGHPDPVEAVRSSIKSSDRWWVLTVDGVEEGVLGVTPMPDCAGWGAPWMLSSPAVFWDENARTFLRRTPEFMAKATEGYDVLFNLISEHNHKSKRWLRFAGFQIKDEPAHIFNGFRFNEFIYVKPGGHYDPETWTSNV